MWETFVVKNIEIRDKTADRFGALEPRLVVRINLSIVDEHGFESATGQLEKNCSTWTDVKAFISGYCDKEEAENLVNAYVNYYHDRIIRFKKLHNVKQ